MKTYMYRTIYVYKVFCLDECKVFFSFGEILIYELGLVRKSGWLKET